MRRFLTPLAAAVCALAALPAVAQEPPLPPTQADRKEIVTVVAPAPVPALRYELLPPARDRVPGNAAVGYFKAITLRPAPPKDAAAAQKQQALYETWNAAPIDRLPAKDAAEYLKPYRDMLRAADEAARCDRCDWHPGTPLKIEDIQGMLSSVQGNREVIRGLKLRARLELAEKRPADAVRTVQTMFQIAKHYGEGGTAIQMLVGLAFEAITLGCVEDMIRQPDGPNLYWALTAAPHPLVDPRPALDGEAEMSTSFIPNLRELTAGPMTEARAVKTYQDAIRLLKGSLGDAENEGLLDLLGRLEMAAGQSLQGPRAKTDLTARGWPAADVDAMPNAQAVLLRAVAVHRELWDDQVKLFYLPYPAALTQLAVVEKRTKAVGKTYPNDAIIGILSQVYPALSKVHESHRRLVRRVAQLRAVEAVRLQAAVNGGVLPKTLADVTVVPVPDDPNTGKPFEYAATTDTFTLTAPPPPGEKPNLANAVEYVVTVRKAK
ncbi:hypothetical protein [Fimbriiglobus ruber]|uniref:Uncharacterized protein n=1 Tax=Fimbriiglobus ruber TaxID=1908690 RepID=A0A225EB16_9BACT|nr:hypothetical protein [Fimbriiglobus ruber]OWK45735.1 hypothetical protein FRUB_02066 [Fimbriiglobus ruber]